MFSTNFDFINHISNTLFTGVDEILIVVYMANYMNQHFSQDNEAKCTKKHHSNIASDVKTII